MLALRTHMVASKARRAAGLSQMQISLLESGTKKEEITP